MEYIPYIISSYGYYSIISRGIANYNKVKWVMDTISYIIPKKEKWEMVEEMFLVEPEETNVFIMSLRGDFVAIDPLVRHQSNC